MKLSDLIGRAPAPEPWSEGEKIPWHEPEFSRRMLAEHLSQAHDRASRRSEIIDAQVAWIHEEILSGRPGRVLDLGCGPGLYAERLVARGHAVVGIDISPASIAHARATAPRATFVEGDIRSAALGEPDRFSAALLLFGEVNAFRERDLQTILARAAGALEAGGALLLEPHTLAALERIGTRPPLWYSAERGLFSDRPHLCLRESFWDAPSSTASERWWVVDTETAEVTRHVSTLQGHSEEAWRSLLAAAGFEQIRFHPGVGAGVEQEDLFALVARKARRR